MTVVNLGLTGHREVDHPLAATSSHGELVDQPQLAVAASRQAADWAVVGSVAGLDRTP